MVVEMADPEPGPELRAEKAPELSKQDIAQKHLRVLQEILADIGDKEIIPRWEASHLFEPLLKALAGV
jgi:hypothetical protein